ncbi:hypothetical protein CG736_02930 [Kitasatospora sp. CB02891]|nr:hypothetical protein CG736_02930 [Kitasatospora sp. CB02891]
MVSLDGLMMMNTTVRGDGTVSTITIRPEPDPRPGPGPGPGPVRPDPPGDLGAPGHEGMVLRA